MDNSSRGKALEQEEIEVWIDCRGLLDFRLYSIGNLILVDTLDHYLD